MKELVYLKDGEIWIMDRQGRHKKITDTNEGIYTFREAPDMSLIVFVSGKKVVTPNNFIYVIPDSVFIYSPENEEMKKIYELKIKEFPQSEYAIQITDVGISNDAKKIAITTSDSLFVYDVDKGELEEIFSLPVSDPYSKSIVLLYSNPLFSPDNTKIVFSKNFYERVSKSFVDLTTRNIHDLPIRWEMGLSKHLLGYLDNQTLIISHSNLADYENIIEKLNLNSPENTLEITRVKGLTLSVDTYQNKVYLGTLYYTSPGTNNEEIFYIYEIDIQTAKKKTSYPV